MAYSRKDRKGRVLRKGETQRKCDGKYVYTYMDTLGRRRSIYSKDIKTLREREEQLVKDQLDGLDTYVAGSATVNFVFDRYISTKSELRETTRTNYKYMYDRFVKDGFGKKKIAVIKFSDVLQFYQYLLKDKKMQVNTLETIHTVLHPTFQLAVRDNIIRTNPSDGVMAQVKKLPGRNHGVRHALTLEQQRAFIRYIENNERFESWVTLFKFLLGTGCRIGDDDDKIRLNQRKPSKYKGLSRFGPEKNLQRINKFMKERPTFYKKLIQMKENFRFYLRCFYCITKVVILQFNSEKQDRISS